MERLKVTLYVKGKKKVAKVDDRSRWGSFLRSRAVLPGGWDSGPPPNLSPDYKVYREVEYKSVLPEDQRLFVEMVKALGEHHGFEVEIIDVAKEGFLKKLMREQIEKINTFPTLVTSEGEKIEGYKSEEEIRKLLRLRNKKRQ